MIGPITMGATGPSWTVTVLKMDNSALDLTGATYTGVLYETHTANRKTLTPGNFSTTNATGGIFSYSPIATDTDTPGTWDFETTITVGGKVFIVTAPSVLITPRKAA